MPRQIQASQTDFSYGEVDVDLKRNDSHPARKAGLRQMSNARLKNSGALSNRSGRTALYPAPLASRTEEITMSPGNDFKLEFGAGRLRILNSAGAQVALFTLQGNAAALPWTALNTNLIVYAAFGLQIFICFPGMRPQVVTWDGVATWTSTGPAGATGNYTELNISGQKRTPFYRLSPQGVTLQPAAQTGAGINVVASANIFTAAQIGTRLRFVNRQMTITAIGAPNIAVCTINEALPGSQAIAFSVDPTSIFTLGEVVRGSATGSAGIVSLIQGTPTNVITVQLTSTNITPPSLSTLPTPIYNQTTTNLTYAFTASDVIVGGAGAVQAVSVNAITNPAATTFWDDEVMNDYRGYPASCFVDQFRLGFCDFPDLPNGIGWSAINSPTDLYVGTLPNAGMFELAPNKVRVYYVIPGPEGSEFVLCDKRVYYIPISETNPLKPGSVAFKTLTGDGAAQVMPHLAQEAILYVNAGRSTVMAILATGAYLRPFNTKSLTDYHAHLFNNIQCIAAPGADGQFNERYAYVLNGDGSIAVGKYTPESLSGNAPVIGWGPWSGGGTVKWIAAWGQDVLFTSAYFGATICEILDDTKYLDAGLFVNALPAPFAAPVGKGPLWWIPNQSVMLMDQATRPMGIYQIDANGFIVPQNNGGENLLAASLVAGQPWTMTVEPFAPDAQSGADMGQRMKMRQFSYFAAYVINSTGFLFAGLFSSKQTRTSPALGTIQGIRRVPAYNQDDDATLPPVLRETTETFPPMGSSFDPRVAIIKDTPGPLLIAEIAMEITP